MKKINKQELVEVIEALPAHNARTRSWIDKKVVLGLVRQLDEPEKPVVPQFVADWIEYAKFEDYHLLGAMDTIVTSGRKNLYEWFWDYDDNMETFARAWLDGYEVEKEKRYLVKIKGVNEEFEYLVFGELSNTWKFRSLGSFGELKKHHTRKELEQANFGWVFDCPGIEVEEVQDD